MEFIKLNFGSLALSVLFHVVVVAFMTVGLARAKTLTPPPPQLAIEAVVVDQAHIDAALEEIRLEERREKEEPRRKPNVNVSKPQSLRNSSGKRKSANARNG